MATRNVDWKTDRYSFSSHNGGSVSMFRKAQDYCKYSVVGYSCWLISMATRFSCFLPWLLEMMLWKLIVTGFSSRVAEVLIVLSKTDRYRFQFKSCSSRVKIWENLIK